MSSAARIYTASSSATAPAECAGHVLVSGSYGGEYNAFHAGKRGIRGVVLNDAGVGRNGAGIAGLAYLDRVHLPGATADARTCHIGDGEHMLAYGVISHVNESAQRYACAVGQSVRQCAQLMTDAPIVTAPMPPISGGCRYVIREIPGEPRVIALDAAPMLEASDAGSIVVTGSHAALFRGKPDGLIQPDVHAIFFSDAGIGLDEAGVTRLALLDERHIVAGAASADSAAIGDARSIYADGVLSRVNATARAVGGTPGMRIRDFIELLIARARAAG
jgi:hypothetical protein